MINQTKFAEPISCAMFLNSHCDVLIGHGKYVSLLRNLDYYVYTKSLKMEDLIRVAQKVDNERMHQLKMKDEVMKKGTDMSEFFIGQGTKNWDQSSD